MDGDDDYAGARVARILDGRDAGRSRGGARRRVAEGEGRARAPPPRPPRRTHQGAPTRARSLEPLLTHKEERVRSEAAAALGTLGDAAAVRRPFGRARRQERLRPPRGVATRSESSRTRRPTSRASSAPAPTPRKTSASSSSRALFDRGDPEAIPALATLFDDKSWRVASAALAAAGALGIDDDMARFMPFIEHRDWRVRAAAFEALGRLRAVPAFPKLIVGLSDKDPVVRGVCHANLQILSNHRISADPKALDAMVGRTRRRARPHQAQPEEGPQSSRRRRARPARGATPTRGTATVAARASRCSRRRASSS